MFDDYLRRIKDRLLMPVALALGPGVSPAVITWLALVVGLAAAGAVVLDRPLLALALWLINRTLDGLDGTQARAHARESQFGAYLDIVFDFVVYAAIPVAIAVERGTYGVAVSGMLLLGAFYVNAASWMFLAAILEQRREGAAPRGESTAVTMPKGLVAGAETVLFYSLFLLYPAFVPELFIAMAALVLLTAGLRVRWAWAYLRVRGSR